MANGRIDENGLPVYAPGDFDYVRVVDRSTGASRNALVPEVTAAARVLAQELGGLVQDARDDIEQIIRGLGYLPPVAYASGLNVNDIKFTVSYNGDVYAPKPELVPFTTGAWNPAQWNVIQGDINLRSDLADPTGGAGLVTFQQAGAGSIARSLAAKVKESHLSPEDFGAIGDGVTDDYDSWAKLVAAANLIGAGVKIQCGFGRKYYLNRHVHSGTPSPQLAFTGIKRLHIDLNGSRVKVKGDFARSAATTHSMSGIKVVGCSDVVIENGVVDGSVDETTNPNSYAETQSHGIYLQAVDRCSVRKIECHHWATDGIYIGGTGSDPSTYTASKYVTVEDCVSRNNGRQAMSITMVHEAIILRCKFLNSGFTAAGSGTTPGGYGHHSPAAGVDIEPNTEDRFSQDLPTQGIQFVECVFRGNRNYQCLIASPTRVERVSWVRCLIDARNGSGSYYNEQYNFWPGCVGAVVEGCEIYGNISVTSIRDVPNRVGSITFRGTTFYCASNVSTETVVFGSTSPYVDYIIDGCTFVYKQDVVFPGSGTSGFPRISSAVSHVQFTNNEIIIADHAHPKAYDSGAANAWPVARISGSAVVSRNNRFSVRQFVDTGWRASAYYALGTIVKTTDGNVYLVTVAGKSGSAKPTHTSGTAIDGTVTLKYLPTLPSGAYFYNIISAGAVADNDQYLDASKWAPTNAVYTAGEFPHSVGKTISSQGYKYAAATGGTGATHYAGSAAPVAGTYIRGDVVFNSVPVAGGKLGWVCIAAGTPGTWKPFGAIDP